MLTKEAELLEPTLTPQEIQAVLYTAHGYTNQQTADELIKGNPTIKTQLHYARERSDHITTERLVYLATLQYFNPWPIHITEQGAIPVEKSG